MSYPYSWLLLGLTAFDVALTLIGITYFGAAEANPLMAWMIARSILLFITFKMGTVGVFIYLADRAGKFYYIKFAFWAYLVIYLIMTVGLNHRGYIL
jgi:hypothetical protein